MEDANHTGLAATWAALALLGCCGRTDLLPNVAATGTGGIASTAGAMGTGGHPNTGGSTSLAGSSGASGLSDKCETITTAQFPVVTVPVCTFAGGAKDQMQNDGCPASSVDVTRDAASYYFVVNHAQRVIRCPVGVSDARVFEDVRVRTNARVTDTLYGQTRSNGLIRFVCETDQFEGDGYSYRSTCSPSGIQTGQPEPKSGLLYVLFPEGDSDVGTPPYVGRIYGYSCSGGSALDACPKSISFYAVNNEAETPLGSQPLSYANDHKTLLFNDLYSRAVTIALDENFEVADVRW